ncbi:MAG: hypothetical protein ACI8XU_000892 [Kiritimatiellia bacterium]|jgi:uncharacterized protein YhhL (DUF1145 family)
MIRAILGKPNAFACWQNAIVNIVMGLDKIKNLYAQLKGITILLIIVHGFRKQSGVVFHSALKSQALKY